MGKPTVLIVEDDSAARSALEEHLRDEGYRPLAAENGQRAMELFRTGVDVVLLDYALPDTTGFEIARGMNEHDPSARIIMVTSHAALDHAVAGMKLGLFDYLSKPVDLEQLSRAIRNALVGRMPLSTAGCGLDAIVGDSPPMRSLLRVLRRVARSRQSTVLLTGETGTGKGLAARALHDASPRAAGPFMNVTCTALPSALLESELFGHERGAFTGAKTRKQGLFELADGGTLFLDEVGDMEPGLQAKLLRVLEERRFRRVGGTQDIEIDVRLIAATNVDLPRAVAEHRFREDLYYRLAVLVVELPPLRERGSDVLLLAERFLTDLCAVEDIPKPEIGDGARLVLRTHPWPGNVRELRNALERAVLMGEGPGLEFPWLDESSPNDGTTDFELPVRGVDFRALERRLVQQALARTRGNITRAASLLGMNRDQMRYRVEKFRLREPAN